jgi:hypothetical protein
VFEGNKQKNQFKVINQKYRKEKKKKAVKKKTKNEIGVKTFGTLFSGSDGYIDFL